MLVKAKTRPTSTHKKTKWVKGYYLPKAVMTGENFNGFIDTYSDEVGPIIVEPESFLAHVIDESTLAHATSAQDVHGNTIFEGDYIDLDGEILKVISYCDFIAYKGMRSSLMPSLICEKEDGTHDQLVKKSSGDDWMKLNTIESSAIVIVENPSSYDE